MLKQPEDLLKLQSDMFSASNAVVSKTIEHWEKLAELNLKAANDGFNQSADQLKALFAAKDPQEAAKLFAAMAKPSTEGFTAYAKDVVALTNKAGAELTALAEKQIADGNKQLQGAVELLAKNAPAGSEGAVQMLRTTLSAASAAYEQVFKVTKQLAEQAEQGLAAATKATTGKKGA